MRIGTLGTLTIGQAPRLDVVPIIDRHVPRRVRRIHRGVLDGLSRAEIAARYLAEPGEAALVTRLKDRRVVELSRSRMRDGAEQALKRLEADGCDVIVILCSGTFEGLQSERAWLVEPDHIIPATVAGLLPWWLPARSAQRIPYRGPLARLSGRPHERQPRRLVQRPGQQPDDSGGALGLSPRSGRPL